MTWLTRFSLKNTAAVIIIALLIALLGTNAATGLKKETMPDVSIPVIAVITPYPGASTSDIRDLVSEPLQKSLTGIPGLKDIDTTSTDNVSAIVAQFDYSANLDDARKKMEEEISKVKLPDGVVSPQIIRMDFSSYPILKVSLSNKNLSPAELEKQIRAKIVPDLTTVAGVGQATVASQQDNGVYIRLLPEKLKEKGITFQQVQQLLQGNNLSYPISSVTFGDQSLPVRLSGKITSIDDVKNLLIPVFPDSQKQLAKSFTQMGNGIADLGQAVGQLGQSVGQIGQSVGQLGESVGKLGQGMNGMSQALNAQIQLVSAISETQNKLLSAKLALQQENAILANPTAKAGEKAKAQKTIVKLTKQIQIGQTALNSMQKQLKTLQSSMNKAGKTSQSSQTQAAPSQQQNTRHTQQPAHATQRGQSTSAASGQNITLVKLKDIAQVREGSDETTALSRMNGSSSVVLDISKTQDANTVDTAEGVKSQLKKLTSRLPKGTEVKVIFDQSTAVKQSINGMLKEGILGAVFACIVILVFLRNVRSTLISIISIPLSILIALVFLKQLGITLNVMTLGGLAVAVGRVVDDSIVVIENTYRHIVSAKQENRDANVILMAVKEVASAITSSTLTTMAVFLPLGMVSGVIGKVFLPFAITVVFALTASLLVALTIVPLLAKLFLAKQKSLPQQDDKKGKFTVWYQHALSWSLDHKAAVSLTALILFIGSLALVPLIGTGFIPDSKEKYVSIDVRYPVGTTLETTDKTVKKVETLLDQENTIDFYQTTVGSAPGSLNMQGSLSGSNSGNIFVQLTNNADVDSLVKKLQHEVKPLTDDKANIKVAEMNPNSVSNNNVEVTVTGNSLAGIKQATETLMKKFAGIKNVAEVSNNLSEEKPEIDIDIKQDKAAKEGLSAGQLLDSVRQLLTTQKVTTYKVDKDEVDINLGLKLAPPAKLKDISSLEITTPMGNTIQLSDVADIKQADGPVTIQEKNGDQYATITLVSKTNNVGSLTKEVSQKLSEAKLPKTVKASIGGVTEQMNQGFSQLGMALVVAIIAVYLVMVITFGGAKAPFAILFSLPMAIIGGLLGLFITGKVIDMPAMIGALMLVGIVVTNAIVLIDRVQQQRQNGLMIREALLEAGSRRLRPILMTAVATVCAMLPMSLGMSEGAMLSQSLAIVVIGGLTTSTFLTLIIVPVVYEMIYRKDVKHEHNIHEHDVA